MVQKRFPDRVKWTWGCLYMFRSAITLCARGGAEKVPRQGEVDLGLPVHVPRVPSPSRAAGAGDLGGGGDRAGCRIMV